MSALAFGFEDQLVRVHDRGGAPWFVAQDVCSCLEIANSRDAVASLDEDEKGYVGITDAMGRDRQTAIVSESGVYVLIFRSRKESAKRFRKWVTSEVLPTLRRTGSFEMPDVANDQCEPLDGGRMDRERQIVQALAVVRLAKEVWGRGQARKIWRQMGLPDGCRQTDGPVPAVESDEQVDTILAAFLEECTQDEEGTLVRSSQLNALFEAWCRRRGHKPVHTIAFAKAMENMGYARKKSNGIWWLDISPTKTVADMMTATERSTHRKYEAAAAMLG